MGTEEVRDDNGNPISKGDRVLRMLSGQEVEVAKIDRGVMNQTRVWGTDGFWSNPGNLSIVRYAKEKVTDVRKSGPVTTTTTYSPGTVEDFKGEIDGAGVKSVMASPKCPLDLIPPQFSEGVAEVLKHGAQKYAPGNWMRGMSWETVLGGVQRHIQAFRRGEEIDPESGLPHLHHAACGLMFASWFAHGPQAEQHRKFDDRKFKGA